MELLNNKADITHHINREQEHEEERHQIQVDVNVCTDQQHETPSVYSMCENVNVLSCICVYLTFSVISVCQHSVCACACLRACA